jgi:HNH endonuclease
MVVPTSTRRLVRERAQLHCEYCHADERWQFVRFTIDHILPQSAGGSAQADNLALARVSSATRRSRALHINAPILLANPKA